MEMVNGHPLLLSAAREFGASIDVFAGLSRGTSSALGKIGISTNTIPRAGDCRFGTYCKPGRGFPVGTSFMRPRGSLLEAIGAFQVLPIQSPITSQVATGMVIEAEAFRLLPNTLVVGVGWISEGVDIGPALDR